METIRRYKGQLIAIGVFYVIICIEIVGAFSVARNLPENQGAIIEIFSNLAETMKNYMKNPFKIIGGLFSVKGAASMFFTGCFWLLMFFIGMTIWFLIKNGKKHEYEGIESGSSEWSKGGEEYRKLADGSEVLNKKEGFILSKTHYLGTDLRKVKINKNILVVGGSGAGKSACYIKPNILQKLGSYVITDPKGELYRETSGFLKESGYEVKAFNLVNPEYSDRYNPLAHIVDHTSVDIIAHTIVTGATKGAGSNDPFWDETAKMLLKACIYYVISVLPKEEQNISSCLNIIRQGGADGEVFKKLFTNELKPEHPGRKEYENFSTAADKTMQSIVVSTISKITAFDTPAMQRITTSNNIDFDDLGKKKVALFVITSASDSTYDFISTIFFSQLLQKLYVQADRNGGTLSNQVYFLLDEFANIGQIPDFNKKLSTTRSLGISISIVVQSLDQLEALYKDNYENILGNCDTHLFLGSQSIKTCEYFSKSLGQKTIKFESKSKNRDKDNLSTQGISLSEQRQGRELMTIDELKRMSPDDEILLIRGLKPIMAKKAWYFRYHPMRDIAKRTEIRNISEMPKTEEVEVKMMDVQKHINDRIKKAKEVLQSKSEIVVPEIDIGGGTNLSETKAKTNNDIDIDLNSKQIVEKTESFNFVKDIVQNKETEMIDLQKELERKFDEIFGTTSDTVE